MAGPSWLPYIFAAVMLAVAAYCVSRLVFARLRWRATEVDSDSVHIVMGVAMAGMLVSRLHVLPAPAWEAVFAVSAAWFAWQAARAFRGHPAGAWRCPYPVPHLLESGAMLYMLLAVTVASHASATAGMGAMAGGAVRFPVLGLGLALCMIGYAVWVTDRIAPLTAARSGIPAVAGAAGPGSTGAACGPAAARTRAPADAGETAGQPGSPGARGSAAAAGRKAGPGQLLAPGCAAACKIAMGVTMGYVLIIML